MTDSALDDLVRAALDAHAEGALHEPPAQTPASIAAMVSRPNARVYQIMLRNPAMPAVVDEVAAEPALAVLRDPEVRIAASVAGSGLTLRPDLPMLSIALVASAADAVVGRGLSRDDPAIFEEEVRRTYDAFLRLLSGETCETLLLVGFDGLTLAEGARVELPWGTLRPASSLDGACCVRSHGENTDHVSTRKGGR